MNAKTIAAKLRTRCLRELRDQLVPGHAGVSRSRERPETEEPIGAFLEIGPIFRGGPHGESEGNYHFTVSEEETQRYGKHGPVRSETNWQCAVYVTPQGDVFVSDFQGSVPQRQLETLLACALRGRD